MFKRLVVGFILSFIPFTLLSDNLTNSDLVANEKARASIQKHLSMISQRIKYLDERFEVPGANKTLTIQIKAMNIDDQAGVFKHLDAMSDWIVLEWFAVRRDYYESHKRALYDSLQLVGKKQILASDLDYLKKGMQRWSEIDEQLVAVMNNYIKLLAERAIVLAVTYQAGVEKRTTQLKFIEMSSKANKLFTQEEKAALKPIVQQLKASKQRENFLDGMLGYLAVKMRKELALKKIFNVLDAEPRLAIDEPKDSYRITELEILNYGWWKQKTQFDQGLTEIDEKIQNEQRALQRLEDDFSTNDNQLEKLSTKINKVKTELKPILETLKSLLAQKAPEPYRADFVKYTYHNGIAETLEDEIIALEDKAQQQEAKGQKNAAKQIRTQVALLFEDLNSAEQQAADAKGRLIPYFDNLEEQTVLQKNQSIKLKDEFNSLTRRRQIALSDRQDLQNKQLTKTDAMHQLHQQRNTLLEKKIAFLKKDEPKIESIYVQANGKTVYIAKVRKNPNKEFYAMQELVEQAKNNLQKVEGQYKNYKARFEMDFDDSRTALSQLGGATGAIMQTAYLQAGAESLFYFIDIADEWAKGGPMAALADAIGKGVVAWTSDQPAFESADEQKVLKSLFGDSNFNGAKEGAFSLSTLKSVGIERARTEAYMYGVRDKALNEYAAKLIDGAKNSDASFSKNAKALGQYLISKGKVTESLTKGKDYLSYLRKSKKALKGVMGEYAKDLLKNYLKESAKAIEESAWADYFIQDMVARKSFLLFQRMRNEYWQALDIYRDLVSAKNEILSIKNNYDFSNEMLISQNDEIEHKSYLKVSIYGPSNEYSEDITLGSVKLLDLKAHQYYWHADQLNAENKGDVKLSIVQKVRVN